MCLAIPSRITEINENMGVIDVVGVQREVSLLLVENPQVGDWVIVHAGFAIQIIDEATAQESLRYLREAAQLLAENDDSGTAANG
ncbi:MAG: HypC/HybG/HupF family hydrogenase formation chaperone [Desulfobacteraceae bacterium]|jgi:hydrogenase expression/formation protein HypC|nr:HypC/HybG/HupF family hydrogenase formation chaperone [Desulfobacteraceae bacterium]MBC2753436.1 HypC/HybG/HupF family hydrogenase formation chaperone [Desulfobacteraceae bacterium]